MLQKNLLSKRLFNLKGSLYLGLIFILLTSSVFKKKQAEIKLLPKDFRKAFVYIPEGKVISEQDTSNCSAFFIQKTEVSNFQYQIFLNQIRPELSPEEFSEITLDTLNWRQLLSYGEPVINLYHSHPAYHNYPVVNVSKKGAEMYCLWLSAELNDNPTGQEYIARLPTSLEWLRSTRPFQINNKYAFTGSSLYKTLDEDRVNYNVLRDDLVSYNDNTGEYTVHNSENFGYDKKYFPSPCDSYFPSDEGVYHLNGNVAELTSDDFACGGSWLSGGYDVRNESKVEFVNSNFQTGFRPIIELVNNK